MRSLSRFHSLRALITLLTLSYSVLSQSVGKDAFVLAEDGEVIAAEGDNQTFFRLNSAYALLGTDSPAQLLDLPIGTCNAQTPCPNGACCSGGEGGNGLCGYSPAECGATCTSNCDAKAECGQYGAPGKQTCPLGVCCSKFG